MPTLPPPPPVLEGGLGEGAGGAGAGVVVGLTSGLGSALTEVTGAAVVTGAAGARELVIGRGLHRLEVLARFLFAIAS